MRILVAHQVPRARTGGMSRLMGFVHDRVAAAGHEVDYLCADDVPARWSGAYGRRVAFPLAVRARVTAAAREGCGYDVVNVHEPSAAPAVFARKRNGNAAVVVTSHGLERRAWALAKEEARFGREAPGWRTRLLYPPSGLWAGSWALRGADHVFCLNEEDRYELVEQLGRPAHTVTRITPGADLVFAMIAGGRDYARRLRLLFAGTWRKNKGTEDLVPAFTALARRHESLSLRVVGAGVPSGGVQERFPEDVRSRVSCATPSDERGTAEEFAAADIFVLPSLFEGTPLTLMQAMMSGLPIVTTATCGMKDVVVDRRNGLLVPIRRPDLVSAAVEALLADCGLRAGLGTSARSDALQRHTWDCAAEPVLRAYENLV